ncbi:unnamed protein product [Schistosoma turkestanicum]|nr:unnamed protein product [Schistosoma turkestanicum]
MSESISKKHEILTALGDLRLSIFDTLINDKMWNRIANDILKTPSFNSNLDKLDDSNVLSMIRLLPSYEKLLINFKEKLQIIINSCQPNDYDNLITILLNLSGSSDNNTLPNNNNNSDLLQLLSSSSLNRYTKQSTDLHDNLDISSSRSSMSRSNHNDPPLYDDINCDRKSSRRYSGFSDLSSVWIPSNSSCSLASPSSSSTSSGDSSLTLCPKSSSSSLQAKHHTGKNSHYEQNKSKDFVSKKYQMNHLLSERYFENTNEHRLWHNSSSNIQNSIYSFSDGESSFSSCLNNIEFTVMNQDQLINLASALDSRSSRLDCRQKALKQLVHLPIIDVQACEVWIYLNDNLTSQSPSSSSSTVMMKTTATTTTTTTTATTTKVTSPSSVALINQEFSTMNTNTTTTNNNNSSNKNNLRRIYSITNTPGIMDKMKVDYKNSHKLPISASSSSSSASSTSSSSTSSPSLNLKALNPIQQSRPIDDHNANNKDESIDTTNKSNISSINNNNQNQMTNNNVKMITTGGGGGGLRRGLADALNDEDDILWSLSLRYISKGLSTTPPNIRETYSLLIEYLQLQFTQNAHQYPLLKDGVDFQQTHNKRVLKACYLMNKFHQTIPFYWIRYSEQFVNEIIGKCLNILSIGCKQFNEEQNYHQLRLNPFHLFSLVDCETKWFIQSTVSLLMKMK